MADAVTTRTLFGGTRTYVQQYTNTSDGTGESAVKKLDISTLTNSNGDAVTAVKINQIWPNTNGMSVNILTDHTTDILMYTVKDNDTHLDFRSFGGIKDTGSGGTGDVLFTTVGHTNGDTYNIIVEYVLT
jgi:hypothetical protein